MKPTLLLGFFLFAAPVAFAGTDLDLDPGFGPSGQGWVYEDFNVPSEGNNDEGLRAFNQCDMAAGLCIFPPSYHYYLAGFHAHTDGHVDAAVSLLDESGALVPSFGSNGKLTVATGLSSIRDVAFDSAANRLYFVGGQRLFATTSLEFGVFCLDLTARVACSDFGDVGNGTQLIIFDLGGGNDDVATRVVYRAGSLYVGGYAAAPNGFQMAIAKLNSAHGGLVTAFNGTGQKSVVLGDRSSGQDVNVFDMAISATGSWLYLVGDYNKTTGDYDGFAYALSASNGGLGNLQSIAYENDNPGLLENDGITAIGVQANGKLALAGFSGDIGGVYQLMLARLDPGLALDPSFCGSGVCVKHPGYAPPHDWSAVLPSAIAERPGNRDLVIGLQAITWRPDFVGGSWLKSQKQVVQQYGASGKTLHASTEMEFPGNTPAAYSEGMSVNDSVVELVGTRVWDTSNNDLDITMMRLRANDSIFANQFGGSNSD